LGTGDLALIEDFRRLTTSDHFYYMCTKYFNDGDIHAYFSPYETPYEAYMNFMNAFHDINSAWRRKAWKCSHAAGWDNCRKGRRIVSVWERPPVMLGNGSLTVGLNERPGARLLLPLCGAR
jgi:hypothetical protein